MLKRLLCMALLIGLAFFPSACASRDPVELITFSLYAEQFTNVYQSHMYVDYINRAKGKTVEQAELTIEGNFAKGDGQNITVFRLFEIEGIPADGHNQEHDTQTNIFKENETYTAYLSKVYFTDGSYWENEDQSGKISASVWAPTAKNTFPLRLAEANFYRQYEGAKDIEFNVDYINMSADKTVTGTVFEITPKETDGTICKKADGSDAVIYLPVFPAPVSPGTSNQDYHYTLSRYSTGDLSSAVLYEIRMIRVLTDDGTIYDCAAESPLNCIMLGKKGYDFTEKTTIKDVNDLIDSLNKSFEENEMDEGEPLIYIREKEYAVLRYKNADISIELDDTNHVRRDSVSFSAYLSQNDYLNPEKNKEILQMADNLYRCIFCTVLDEAPYDVMLKAVNEYLQNDSGILELNGTSLEVFEDGGLVYDENGDLLINFISGTGSGLDYDPSIRLTWAKNTIY